MNGVSGLYGDVDMTKVMFGENARTAPAWVYVQHQGDGVVALAGASKVTGAHPFRYGSDRAHVLVVGDIVFRPRLAVGTDALMGYGLGSLFLGVHDEALLNGELVVGSDAEYRDARERLSERRG